MALRRTMAEVITIDSDSSDEFETSIPKRPRLHSPDRVSGSTQDALKKLDSLKEISTFHESHYEVKMKTKNCTNGNSLTIIIDEVSKEASNRCSSHISISDGVVVIDPVDDDPLQVPVDPDDPLQVPVDPKENVSNDCTVILDDPSEESEEVKGAISEDLNASGETTAIPNEKTEQDEKVEVFDRPSTSKASETHKILDQFLETCATSIKGSKYEDRLLAKFSKMRKHFNDCDDFHNESSFKSMLEDHVKTAKYSAADAVVSFQRIYSYLLDNINGASIEIPEGNLQKIKKLEKVCKLLVKKLQQLEEAEVDFDDENDSTYIQIDRYSQRLNKVYNKYCQLINKNPHTGRLLYEKLRFVSSKYDEINRAISKTHRHNKFPTYYDIEKCIRSCTTKHNLPLTEADIKEESKQCFTNLGNLLQLRRKKELYEVHCSFITLNEDPANNDPELKVKLQDSLNEGQNKMKEVVEKYVKLQDSNVSVNVSEDSDDSHYKSSDSEQ